MLRRGILFGLIAAFAVVLGFFSFRSTPGDAVTLVQNFGYWQILLLTVAFGYCLVRSLRSEFQGGAGSWWRTWRWPALAVLGVTAFLHVQEPHGFKILMDEVVLQDTAMEMHYHRIVSTTVRAYDLVGNFTSLVGYVDKRPVFFPFLISLAHDLTGYRVENAFVVNALVSLALVALTFLIGRRLGGNPAGYGGILLLVSIPLVHQNATGSGFELLNLAMIAATIWLGFRWVERPDTDRLGAFVFSGILLAQTRYESALFILPLGGVILYQWWRQRRPDFSWPILVAPLFLIIVPLHLNVFKISTFTWQLRDIPGAETPFSPAYFYENVGHALYFYFSLDNIQPSSFLVSALGFLGVGFLVMKFAREHRRIFHSAPVEAVTCIFMGGLLLHTVLMLCYFWGHFDDPVIRRLSLPSHLLFIISFLYIFPSLVASARRWQWLSATTLLFIFSVTVPLTAMHRYNQENFSARANNWLNEYIDTLGEDSVLAIDENNSLQWFLHKKSSISVGHLARNVDKFEFVFRNRSFQHFLIVQRMGTDFESGARFPNVAEDTGDGLVLEPIAERSFSPIYTVRISRVVGLDIEKLREWAALRMTAVEVPPDLLQEVKEADYDRLEAFFRMLP